MNTVSERVEHLMLICFAKYENKTYNNFGDALSHALAEVI